MDKITVFEEKKFLQPQDWLKSYSDFNVFFCVCFFYSYYSQSQMLKVESINKMIPYGKVRKGDCSQKLQILLRNGQKSAIFPIIFFVNVSFTSKTVVSAH